MAYSNWGAFVYKDGKRRSDKEDSGVFDTDESSCPSPLRIFANLLKTQKTFPEGKAPWFLHSHHAVLGDNEVRFCGYKSWAELWICHDGRPERVTLDCVNVDADSGEVRIEDNTWKYSYSMHNDNMIDLELLEPDGAVWTATCGYRYGAGHMD